MTEIAATFANDLFDLVTAGSGTDRWLALCTDGSFTEAAGGTYARQDIAASFGAPTAGDGTNDVAVTFTGLAADTYSHWAIFDASTSGNMVVRGAFVAPQSVSGGGSITIAIGDLTVAVDAVP